MSAARALLLAAAAIFAMVVGCNAILGNRSGSLVDDGMDATTSDAASDGFFLSDAPVDQALPDASGAFDAAVGCPPGQKNCAGACISIINPNFGCGGPSCDICPNQHATKVDCIGLDGGIACKATCADGYRDCAGAFNGCETDISKSDNCGGCGIKCSANYVCSKGAGGIYGCVSTCPAGQLQCVAGGDCIDTTTDTAHCGGCTTPCSPPANADPTCAGSTCGFRCKALFHDCGGVCVPDSTVTACGVACKDCTPSASLNVTPSCDLGACTYTCLGGTADCDNDLPQGTSGDGCEVALATSTKHCGTCPNDCTLQGPSGSTASCVGGACNFACNGGSHNCAAACVPDNSTAQCGAGCVDCAANAPAQSSLSCNSGSCAYACALGFADCNGDIGLLGAGNGCETNTTNDNANCGGCNAPCTGSTYCCKSACIDVAQSCL